jgi:transcriptional regulator with XRE-family HTH domain
MVFNRSKIAAEEESVAEILKTIRMDKGLSLEDISLKIGVSKHYLEAIENGDLQKLPGGLYGKTFIKKYAAFLKLNEETARALLKTKNNTAENKNVFNRKRIKSSAFLVFPKIFRNFLAITAILAIFLYLGLYLKNSLSMPDVQIFEPAENIITNKKTIVVSGQSNVKTQIEINNQVVLKDSEGKFSQTIDLKQGLNKISISAQNKYSKKRIIERQILVK